MLKALLFDLDGTFADTESVHCAAFNRAFAEEGLDWCWTTEDYTRLLEISGGKERLQHWILGREQGRDKADVDALIARLHRRKTQAYTEAVKAGQAPLRPGVLDLIHEAGAEGLALGIVTTTSAENVEALMGRVFGSAWRAHFAVVEDASTAPRKKPHPQAYLQALDRLGLGASCGLAFEDSFNGVEAARAAGLAVLVTPNPWTLAHDFSAADCVLPDLEGLRLSQLSHWAALGFTRQAAQGFVGQAARGSTSPAAPAGLETLETP